MLLSGLIASTRSNVWRAASPTARPRVGDAETVQRVGFRVGRTRQRLEQSNAFGHVIGFRQVSPELGDHARVGDAALDGTAQRRRRIGRATSLPFDEGEMPVRDGHVGTLIDDLPVDLNGFGRASDAERFHGTVHRLIDRDQLLGIVVGRICGLPRSAAGDVPERAQLRSCLLILGDPLAGRRALKCAQGVAELAILAGRAAEEIRRFGGIGRQVVPFGQGQLDELVAAEDHAGERRPPAIQLRG